MPIPLTQQRSKVWIVAYDKQRRDEVVFINRQVIGESYVEALGFAERMELHGNRTKIYWEYSRFPILPNPVPQARTRAEVVRDLKMRDMKNRQIEEGESNLVKVVGGICLVIALGACFGLLWMN